MSGRLNLVLRLEERQTDRVRVSVLVAPTRDPVPLDGVAICLVDEGREALSPRMLLPLTGTLAHPIGSSVEVRAVGDIPDGSLVLVTAWIDGVAVEATCPADPCPDLRDHVTGRTAVHLPRRRPPLGALAADERCRLGRHFPWLAPKRPCPPRVVDDAGETARALTDDLGLDPDDADFVASLLAED